MSAKDSALQPINLSSGIYIIMEHFKSYYCIYPGHNGYKQNWDTGPCVNQTRFNMCSCWCIYSVVYLLWCVWNEGYGPFFIGMLPTFFSHAVSTEWNLQSPGYQTLVNWHHFWPVILAIIMTCWCILECVMRCRLPYSDGGGLPILYCYHT